MKRKRRKTLDRINAAVLLTWLISGASAIDTLHWIPFVVFAICAVWLFLFMDDGTKSRGGECNAVDR